MKLEGWRCDICGKESKEQMQCFTLPIWGTVNARTIDSPFQMATEKQIAIYGKPMDMCDDCAKKIADWLYDNGMIGNKGE